MAKETTTSYTWPEGSVITRIDVRMQKNGFAVAYLYADDREEQRETRTNIRAAIRLKGWGTLSDSRDGQFVLRVAGMRSGEELITTLREQGFIKGEPLQVNIAGEEKEEPKGIWNAVASRTLRWSGILATLGNAMSIASGFARGKELGQIGMGASFAIADLPLAIVDEKDNSRQLNLLLKKLTQEYERNGIEIPKNASIYVETSNKGKTAGEHFKDFLHQYANQIKCGFEVVAAAFSIRAGIKQGSPDKIKAAAIFGPGFLASLLIPEKKIDGEKYAQASLISKLWMKIQSNPLSVGGLLGYSNTYFTYKSGFNERRRLYNPEQYPTLPNPKTGELVAPSANYRWDIAIPTIMIGANGLYAMSKKTVGGNIDSDAMVQDAYRIASQIINKQPDGALREKAVEVTAKFFGQRMEIKEHYPDARARLVKELDSQRQNPWFELQGLAPYTPEPKRGPIRSNELDSPALAPTNETPTPHVVAEGRADKGTVTANAEKLLETANAR